MDVTNASTLSCLSASNLLFYESLDSQHANQKMPQMRMPPPRLRSLPATAVYNRTAYSTVFIRLFWRLGICYEVLGITLDTA